MFQVHPSEERDAGGGAGGDTGGGAGLPPGGDGEERGAGENGSGE